MSVFCSIVKTYLVRHCGLFVFFGLGLLTTADLSAQSPGKSGQKSSFTSSLINLESAANETFRYNAILHNGSSEAKVYALHAPVPEGWSAAFRTMGSLVTAVNVEAGKSQDISVEINANPRSKPDKYSIPVTAVSGTDTLKLHLEAVLKGAYGLELSTPSGRLSEEMIGGSQKEIRLVVKNTASLPLEKVELTAQRPSNWEVTFTPSKISLLPPGGTADVTATVKVPDKTIVGDYLSTFTVQNANTSANVTFRITVKTSLLSGWIGIVVILAAIGLVYYLIRKYGRR